MRDLFTDRAIEWFERIAAVARIAMLLFIAYALAAHLGWVDANAVVMALFLVIRSLRSRPEAGGDVHINVSGSDPIARARAAARALEQVAKGH